MKTIGMVADDYKLPKFRAELNEKKYAFTEQKFNREATLIKVEVDDSKFTEATEDIKKLCTRIELHFKRSN